MSLLDPQIQAFAHIAKYGSVHAAADELCITQTAVTQRLKGLEQKLDVSLFIRSRRGMLLTSEGEALLRYCQTATALEGETLAQINGAGKATSVRIGIGGPTSVLQARVLPVLEKLIKEFPGVLLELRYCDNNNVSQWLKTGQIQMAILPEACIVKELVVRYLSPEKYVLVAAKAWKSRKLKDIIQQEKIIDFNEADQMTFSYLKQYDLLHNANHDRHYADHPEAIAALVKEGCGYSVLEESFAEQFIEQGSIITLNRGRTFDNTIALAWYDRPKIPDYFQFIIDHLQNVGN